MPAAIVEHTPPDISFLPINLLSCIALTPRATHFSKLEDVLSGARASAKHSWKPKNSVLPQNLASADLDAQSEEQSFQEMPHHLSGNVAKLEAIVAVLMGQVLTLETQKQNALRQCRQETFEQESAVIEIIQSSAELHYILKKVEKFAKIGKTLGLLPIDEQMRARVQYSQQPDHIAQVPLQERARYEREIVELREISEAMLKELERRVQEVEQAEEAAALWKQRVEALQGRLAASDEEYSKLEKRLVSAANQLRHGHEHELSQRAEENAMLRKKTIEMCDDMSATKRQQHILLECLKEVTCSFLAIGGDRVKRASPEYRLSRTGATSRAHSTVGCKRRRGELHNVVSRRSHGANLRSPTASQWTDSRS